MASIKDIAKICGVSVATVSKALNDKDDIGEETKKRIKEVAKQMGYFPQYYARAIRMNKSFNIGVLFMDEAMSGLTHDYFANILNSFKVTAESKGYDITFINSSKKYKKGKTYLEHCRYRGLDGVVIACIHFDNPEVVELMKSDIPVVAIDYESKDVISVLSNNTVGMQELVEYIISMGHKKIAYISGDVTNVTSKRVESFQKTMKAHSLPLPEEYQISSEYRNLKKAAIYTKQLLELKEPPTCIIYSDDYSAVGGIGQIRAMGLRIPEDISVAGYDDIFIAGQMQPRLTTVAQDTECIGKKAAEKLISLIEKKNVSLKPYIVKTELKKGASVRKID
ncbi:MAG: LacI family DNA-binding transcriptional regulator [Butyribacter sp.]|nr:LacI family DNA-binding transcriptional regulator [bacterium]MDY3854888.1 LacI family DNA-binding transcriptional regulator [Butyribacter sp.]